MKRILICLSIVLFSAGSAGARRRDGGPIELTLQPAKAGEGARRYRLLPSAKEQRDENAAGLYKEAAASLPKDLASEEIGRWVRGPLDELPRKEVRTNLDKLKGTLELIEQAAKCKECDWPFAVDVKQEVLSEYRMMAYAVALEARLRIAEGQYDGAIGSLRTGFAMGRHLGESFALQHGLVGIAISALMCRGVEEFIQGPDAPNLYWALQSLPRPFVDLSYQTKMQFEEGPLREKIELLMKRLDRGVAVLQCIEGLRDWAAKHGGKFPSSLAEITETAVRNDPITEKPFVYSSSGREAVLKGPAPKGADSNWAIDYKLTLKEMETEGKKDKPKGEAKE